MTRKEAERIMAEELDISSAYIPRWIAAWERLGMVKFDLDYIAQRAANNADAPYDEDTCKRYPHAAAARIAFLEAELLRLRSYLP